MDKEGVIAIDIEIYMYVKGIDGRVNEDHRKVPPLVALIGAT